METQAQETPEEQGQVEVQEESEAQEVQLEVEMTSKGPMKVEQISDTHVKVTGVGLVWKAPDITEFTVKGQVIRVESIPRFCRKHRRIFMEQFGIKDGEWSKDLFKLEEAQLHCAFESLVEGYEATDTDHFTTDDTAAVQAALFRPRDPGE